MGYVIPWIILANLLMVSYQIDSLKKFLASEFNAIKKSMSEIKDTLNNK